MLQLSSASKVYRGVWLVDSRLLVTYKRDMAHNVWAVFIPSMFHNVGCFYICIIFDRACTYVL